ncbi:ribosomal RNA small subunit methyltransferase C [Bacillus sp. JCM 19047]|nr:ribosomal RNA small subunit methyltransferase C [Bacillus sp. JCM 19047]
MSDHYYSHSPNAKSEERTWRYTLRGHQFSFTTDRGVFSKGEVDFGSRLLIETFQAPEIDGSILDVGCGYGPIGLALAKEYRDRSVVMIDVNERASTLAEKNATVNGVANSDIRWYENGVKDLRDSDVFASVVTNPPIRAGKETVHEIYEDAYERLLPGGELWVVIQKKQGAPSTKKKLEDLFGEESVEVKAKDKGYFIFFARKIDLFFSLCYYYLMRITA